MNDKHTESPLVSIIIPAYNVESYIKDCITSIQQQTYSHIEIIPVNDGSTDTSGAIIDSMARDDTRIHPIHQKNSGVSAARNAGIEAAKGEWVVFVDGDDYLASDYVTYMLHLAQETGAELCCSLNCFTRKDEPQTSQESIRTLSPAEAIVLFLSPRTLIGSWNKIYKRDILIQQALRFSTDFAYGEGLLFYSQYAQYCTRVGVGNRKVYYYRRDVTTSATTKVNPAKLVNGFEALEALDQRIFLNEPRIQTALNLHKCLFSREAVAKLYVIRRKSDAAGEYCRFRKYLHSHALPYLFKSYVPRYYKALLIGTCLFPSLMAWLRNRKRQHLAAVAVRELHP